MNTAANPIPSPDSGGAAAAPVELPDPVSLQILVKALAASAAAVATSRFGAQLAAVSAVVATLVADAVKDIAKRRRWGRKRLAALTGLLLLFSSVDKAFARVARRLGFRGRKPSASRWPRALATSAAAVGIAVAVLTPPEAALGHSLGTGSRTYTFFPHDAPLLQVRPTNLERPTISGAPIVGRTLRADPGQWSARPEPQLSVRWLRCDGVGAACVRIFDAAQTLRLEAAHAGATIRVLVLATNAAGGGVARSLQVGPVRPTLLPSAPPSPPPAPPAHPAHPGPPAPVPPSSLPRPPAPPDPGSPPAQPPAPPGPPATTPVTPVDPPAQPFSPRPAAPINTALPTIDGVARAGETLIGSTGRWDGDEPFEFVRRWLRCGVGGQDCTEVGAGTSLNLGDEHVGATIVLEVVASNASGVKAARSRPTAPVAARPAIRPANLEPPTITGLAALGSTLSANRGRWTGQPEPTFGLEWLRCNAAGEECAAIDQATRPQYTLTRNDVAKALVLRVTATNSAGAVPVESAPTKQVEGEPLNLELPTISGVAAVAERITAEPGSWSAFPAPDYGYRWLRCDGAGENCVPAHALRAPTILLNPSDAGHTFRVEVTASNALGRETARSSASAPVRRAPVNTARPVVEYDFETGRFTASPGQWEGYPSPRFTYRWQHCLPDGVTCSDIRGGPKGVLYVPNDDQPGCDIRVVVTARNEAGESMATSAIVNSCVD
jgi:hypothetical protein